MSVISAILSIAPYLVLTAGQTECSPLMQSLVSQAEATNSYGSWDACCARTGTDCYLTREAVQPGYEPCDSAHGARAGCNRVPEGTICMIGGDSLITSSPCSWSQLRTCAQTITRSGNVMPFNTGNLTSLGLAPASVLANGVLDSNLCCSASVCMFADSLASCSYQYDMSCISDGVSNVICIPLDESDDSNYAAVIVQGCAASTTNPASASSPSSTSPTLAGSSQSGSVSSTKQSVIGGVAGGVGGLVVILVFVLWWYLRRRQQKSNYVPPSAGVSYKADSREGPVVNSQPPAVLTTLYPLNIPELPELSSPSPNTESSAVRSVAMSVALSPRSQPFSPAPPDTTEFGQTIYETNPMQERMAAMQAHIASLPKKTAASYGVGPSSGGIPGPVSTPAPDVPPAYQKFL
jgi:hypothetical protein